MQLLGQYFTWRWFVIRLLSIMILSPIFLIAGFVLGYKEYRRQPRKKRKLVWYVLRASKSQATALVFFILGGFKGIPKDFYT